MTWWIVCLLFAASAAVAQELPLSPTLEALKTGIVEKRDVRIGPGDRNATAPVLWTGGLEVPNSAYLRLMLRTEGPAFPLGSYLRIFGADDLQHDVALAAIDTDGYWTDLFPLGRVHLALVTGDGPLASSSALIIDSLAYQGTAIVPYSTHGLPQLVRINAPVVPETVRQLAGPIAFLSFLTGSRSGVCSGFLVGRDLLMTNEHCINSAETCRSLTVAFGYEADVEGRIHIGEQYRCLSFDPRLSDFQLDVTVIRLNGNAADDHGFIDLSQAAHDLSGPLVIIQHAGDFPKEVSIADCAMSATPVDGRGVATDFTHTCDTAKGTSGAPVLDFNGNFRGLHHFGFRDDESDIWSENRGVKGVLIRDWLANALATTDEGPARAAQ